MKTNYKSNSMADVETYIKGLHPETEISVIEDRQFIYVEEGVSMVRNWETLKYEGKAAEFKLN